MKLAAGLLTALVVAFSGTQAMASLAEPVVGDQSGEVLAAAVTTVETGGQSVQESAEDSVASTAAQTLASSTGDGNESAGIPTTIIGNLIPTTPSYARVARSGFFFDSSDAPGATISISTVSPDATYEIRSTVAYPTDSTPAPVPLPPALLLFGTGIAGLYTAKRKTRLA